MREFEFTLPIPPRTKKNHSIPIVTKTGKPINLPSKAYMDFERQVKKFFKGKKYNTIDFPINLKCIFYKDKNYKSDLVGYLQAVQDALVKVKLIEDDNHKIIVSTDGSRVELDRDYPRIDITITRLSNEKE